MVKRVSSARKNFVSSRRPTIKVKLKKKKKDAEGLGEDSRRGEGRERPMDVEKRKADELESLFQKYDKTLLERKKWESLRKEKEKELFVSMQREVEQIYKISELERKTNNLRSLLDVHKEIKVQDDVKNIEKDRFLRDKEKVKLRGKAERVRSEEEKRVEPSNKDKILKMKEREEESLFFKTGRENEIMLDKNSARQKLEPLRFENWKNKGPPKSLPSGEAKQKHKVELFLTGAHPYAKPVEPAKPPRTLSASPKRSRVPPRSLVQPLQPVQLAKKTVEAPHPKFTPGKVSVAIPEQIPLPLEALPSPYRPFPRPLPMDQGQERIPPSQLGTGGQPMPPKAAAHSLATDPPLYLTTPRPSPFTTQRKKPEPRVAKALSAEPSSQEVLVSSAASAQASQAVLDRPIPHIAKTPSAVPKSGAGAATEVLKPRGYHAFLPPKSLPVLREPSRQTSPRAQKKPVFLSKSVPPVKPVGLDRLPSEPPAGSQKAAPMFGVTNPAGASPPGVPAQQFQGFPGIPNRWPLFNMLAPFPYATPVTSNLVQAPPHHAEERRPIMEPRSLRARDFPAPPRSAPSRTGSRGASNMENSVLHQASLSMRDSDELEGKGELSGPSGSPDVTSEVSADGDAEPRKVFQRKPREAVPTIPFRVSELSSPTLETMRSIGDVLVASSAIVHKTEEAKKIDRPEESTEEAQFSFCICSDDPCTCV